MSNAKAVAAGLKFRSLLDTTRATWEWWNGISDPAKAAMWDTKRTGRVTPAREAELIAQWEARAKGGAEKPKDKKDEPKEKAK